MALNSLFLIAEAAAAEKGSGEGGLLGAMATDPSWYAFYALLAFFAIVWRMGGFRAITAMLDDRARKIDAELKEAHRLRTEAELLLTEYEGKRIAAEAEARDIVAQAERDAEALRIQAEKDLKDDLDRRERLAEDRIRRAEAQAQAEVKGAAVDAAIAAAQELLRAEMSDARQSALIAKGVKELAGKLK
jgi:F-type H+-transporting ATPase subunit b